MTTLQTGRKLLSEELSVDTSLLDPDRPFDDLGLDSLMLTECLFKLEDKFAISVANSEMKLNTLRDIANMVDRLLEAQRETESSSA
jgi:acyl carrier protein